MRGSLYPGFTVTNFQGDLSDIPAVMTSLVQGTGGYGSGVAKDASEAVLKAL